jgi:hypothetical protein
MSNVPELKEFDALLFRQQRLLDDIAALARAAIPVCSAYRSR